ncbi:MAG: PIN domain-containing protein [Patescibacteria group bacterium]|nr:PIN domain-containing protein [Patescibacteria group bacterium]
MVVVDTNIIIDHIRLSKRSDSRFVKIVKANPEETFALSIISIQELYTGQSSREPRKEQDMLNLINALQILPYTYETAQLAGEIARDNKSLASFADSGIAATAIINAASLLTLNKKDFSGIKNLELI